MKTQINNLRSGTKTQVLNSSVDYNALPKATSHNGHAGTNRKLVESVWNQVTNENQEEMVIRLFGEEIKLTANWSLSRKTVSYFAELDKEFFSDNFAMKLPKIGNPNISIQFGNIIIVSNGKHEFTHLCPSLIDIL